jgi:hypothetical protein
LQHGGRAPGVAARAREVEEVLDRGIRLVLAFLGLLVALGLRVGPLALATVAQRPGLSIEPLGDLVRQPVGHALALLEIPTPAVIGDPAKLVRIEQARGRQDRLALVVELAAGEAQQAHGVADVVQLEPRQLVGGRRPGSWRRHVVENATVGHVRPLPYST